MVFSNKKRGNKKLTHKKRPPFNVIIKNNVQVSKIENSIKPEYYKITEQAENYILRKQYAKAKQAYNNLITKNHYVFARDMHNAIRSSILSRDYKTAIFWGEKLVLKGVPKNYFKSKIFNLVNKHKNWTLFLNKYDSLNKKHRAGINHNLINRLNEIIKIDQTDYIKNSKGEIEKLKLKETTKLVDNEFTKLIKKQGFPTEEKIGIAMSKDSLSIQMNTKYFVLFIHSLQMKNNTFTEIKRIRTDAAKEFKYDAIRDNLDVFKTIGNTCLKIYKGNLYNSKSCNLNNLQIKKITYKFDNEYDFIIDGGSYTVIPVEDEKKDDEYVLNNYDFVSKLTDDWLFYEH